MDMGVLATCVILQHSQKTTGEEKKWNADIQISGILEIHILLIQLHFAILSVHVFLQFFSIVAEEGKSKPVF